MKLVEKNCENPPEPEEHNRFTKWIRSHEAHITEKWFNWFTEKGVSAAVYKRRNAHACFWAVFRSGMKTKEETAAEMEANYDFNRKRKKVGKKISKDVSRDIS